MDLNRPTPYNSVPNLVRAKVDKGPLKILIVDDEQLVRETLKEYLHALGSFEVYLAENAFEGLNTIHRLGGGLDGVLVDINMPGMDGIEFVKRVKNKDRSIVAIIITGYPSSEKVIQAMRAGASDFLAKPFSLDQLSVSLERLAGERKVLKENVYLSRELQVKKALEETNQKLQQKIKEQAILFTISDTLSKTKSTKELYNTLVELACTLTQTEQGLFWVINRDEQKMILMASKGVYDSELETIHYPDSPLPYAQVAKDGIPTLIPAVEGAKRDAALIAIPLFIQKNIFGVLSIACPRPGVTLEDDAVFILHLLTERASLTIENLLLYESVSYNLYSTLTALVSTLEAKDSYTKAHSQRVTAISIKIAEQAGCKDEELEILQFAGSLHDIGKIGIRDEILMKPGRLTPEEYGIIKKHSIIGEKIVRKLGLLSIEPQIIRHHHERWDGKGYPDGLKGEKIPRLARILAIADTFDAITSNRPYRPARDSEFAVKEILKNAGSQFDPELVEVFLSIYKQKRLDIM